MSDLFTYSWELSRDGGPVLATGSSDTFGFTSTDNGAYLVRLSVDDGDDVTIVERTITASNVAPLVDLGPDLVFQEDDVIPPIVPVVIDPGSEDVHSYLWTVTASNGDLIAPETGPTFTLDPSGDGTYLIQLQVTDDDGDIGNDLVEVVIENVAPLIALPGEGSAAAGSVFEETGLVSDVGDDPLSATVDYGDGTVVPLLIGEDGTFSLAHTYADPGDYELSVAVADDGGGAASAILTLSVSDPDQPPLPGDATGDGTVDGADYTLWADNYGQSGVGYAGGDFNNDGTVDGADYTIWADNYGLTVGAGAGAGAEADLNADGVVDGADYTIWADSYVDTDDGGGTGAGAEVAPAVSPIELTGAVLAEQIRFALIPLSEATQKTAESRYEVQVLAALEDDEEEDGGETAATLDYAILDLGPDDPMDLNGDGVVDELDLAAWHPLMLEDDARGDLDGDGVVDEGDLQLLRARILAAAAAAKEDGTIH